MKKNLKMKKIALLTLFAVITSCAPSINVLNSWAKEDNKLSEKNVLVLTKIKDEIKRIKSEEALTTQLLSSNIKAKSSFELFSMLDPTRELSVEEVENAVSEIKRKGFNAIVLTTLKDFDETVHTEQSGGYYAGGGYYGGYYGGFNTYYGRVYSYYDRGVYVESQTTTRVSKRYVLETVTYDLDLPKNKELISITTIEVKDPENLDAIAKQYAKQVVQNILKE